MTSGSLHARRAGHRRSAAASCYRVSTRDHEPAQSSRIGYAAAASSHTMSSTRATNSYYSLPADFQ